MSRLIRGLRRRIIRALGVASERVVYARDLVADESVQAKVIARYTEASWGEYWLPPDDRVEFRGFPPRWTYALADVFVETSSGSASLPNGSLIGDSSAWPPLHRMVSSPITAAQTRINIPDPVAVFPSTGYYHWLIEDFPAFLQTVAVVPEVTLLHSTKLPAYAQEALKLVGLMPVVIEGATQVAVRNFTFTSKTCDSGWPDPQDVRMLRQFGERHGLTDAHGTGERLFLSRKGLRRSPVNEDRLEGLAADRGFSVILPHELTWLEQVRLFAGSKAIVGSHGAAFANQVWMPPGARVAEIFPPGYVVGCFAVLAQQLGNTYSYCHGVRAGTEWRVDERAFLALLDRLASIE